MGFYKKLSLMIAVTLFAVSNTLAKEDRPHWLTNPPKSDETFVYVVGLGEGDTITSAKAEAEKDARTQIIDIAVGTTSSISLKLSVNESDTFYEGDMVVNSEVLQIKGIETESMFEETTESKKTRLYLLKKIPQYEMQELKERYSAKTDEGSALTEVSIKSDPLGAKVFLEGQYRGSTPIQLSLKKGTYELNLQLNGYKAIEKKVMVSPKNPLYLHFPFESLFGYVSIKSISPEDSKLLIDGKVYDQAQYGAIQLEIGKHSVEITRPGYAKFAETIDILAEQNLSFDVILKVAEFKVWSEDVRRIRKLVEARKYQEAIDFGLSIDQDGGEFILGYFYVGASYQRLKNYEQALKWYKLASPLKRRYSQILYNQCLTLKKLNEFQNALKICKEAEEYFPDEPSIHYLLGTIYERMAESVYVMNYYVLAYQYYKLAAGLDKKWLGDLQRYCNSDDSKKYKRCDLN